MLISLAIISRAKRLVTILSAFLIIFARDCQAVILFSTNDSTGPPATLANSLSNSRTIETKEKPKWNFANRAMMEVI